MRREREKKRENTKKEKGGTSSDMKATSSGAGPIRKDSKRV